MQKYYQKFICANEEKKVKCSGIPFVWIQSFKEVSIFRYLVLLFKSRARCCIVGASKSWFLRTQA